MRAVFNIINTIFKVICLAIDTKKTVNENESLKNVVSL